MRGPFAISTIKHLRRESWAPARNEREKNQSASQAFDHCCKCCGIST
ncbi:hypothetical protein DBB42_09405 [Pseudomonas plecoglossicida]|uniref:Uncharacterized protein n=1 Tax=Pseudomonas plecoglossicida TaxID=70775 RepID=A0A2R7UM26_PSEDL|nr:hypothetical protein DBB42_09405 [Pseudomonas plecoglossicida]